MEVPIIRIIVFWGLHRVPLFLGNYYISAAEPVVVLYWLEVAHQLRRRMLFWLDVRCL